MREIHILTVFPEMFDGPFKYSIIKRATYNGLIKIQIHDLRKWSMNNYHSVDDHPFGGGPGMLMQVEPIYKALKEIRAALRGKVMVILTSAKGELYTQKRARELVSVDNIIIIAGHYEGIDNRVAEHLADLELSIGKFVLSGGELPAMIIIDSIIRLIPGALGNEESPVEESYSEPDLLEYPQYTRPAEFKTDDGQTWTVPDVLINGNHKEITKWRKDHQKSI